MKKKLFAGVLVLVTLLSCNRSNKIGTDNPDFKMVSNQVILDWNEMAYAAMGSETYQHSLLASRINAMVHLAMHDALNAVNPVFKTYAFSKTDPSANPIVAAATAAHEVLVTQFPDKKAMLDSMLAVSTANISDSSSVIKGRAIGQQAGKAIVALRATDGALQDPISPIDPSAIPGVYQPVPPTEFLFAPFWKNMKTFGLIDAKQFRVAAQPALESAEYAKGFEEVKIFGRKDSDARSADQTDYAKFWYEFSEAGWNRIAREAISVKKPDLWHTARIFALVNMALADAYTAGWDSKFHYNFWRPYTAIRKADSDNNQATAPDVSWEPLMNTPPVQDYPSTHSALGSAAATVLTTVIGDNVPFTFRSVTADASKPTRDFSSFKQAAIENADSRVMAGLHFRFSCDTGLNLGEKVGKWMVDQHLTPVAK